MNLPDEADESKYPPNSRLTGGLEISKKQNWITENSDGSFSVPSQNTEEIVYRVRILKGKWNCNCPDFKYNSVDREGFECKHIIGTKFWIATKVYLKEETETPKVFSEDSIQCEKCGSIRVIKYGTYSQKQVYKCKDCSHKFAPSLLKKAKFSPELVSLTLDLYFSGMSLRKIARTISDHTETRIGATTVYDWIQRYIPKISEYANSLNPELSDTWHGDELFVKMKKGIDYKIGSKHYDKIAFLWNVMDRKTRFLLASKLSAFRDDRGAFQAFKEARKNSHGQFPEKIFVDKATAYNNIGNGTIVKGWNPQVIAKAGIKKPHANNNRIERLNGTLRERVKVSRGWKSFESAIAEGQRIHYNFVKPHHSLEGMTPAQRASIGINTKNKWLTLLELALSKTNA